MAARGPSTPDETPREFTSGGESPLLESFVPLGVVICHEILHPDLVNRAVSDGAQLLVNIANDGWLDATRGIASRQHFAMAVFRAVETRRYLVRAATTGVSGFIDPWGHIVGSLPPHSQGVLTRSVPGRRGLTPYVRFGDVFAFACVAFALGALGLPQALLTRLRALSAVCGARGYPVGWQVRPEGGSPPR